MRSRLARIVLYSRGELLILTRATGVEAGMVVTMLRTLGGIAVLACVVVLTTLRTCRTAGSLRLRCRVFGAAALDGIFLAVDGRDMRRIKVEIRTADPELCTVGIDPFPQLFACPVSLRTCLTLYAHDIRRQAMTIAAAQAAAMI